MHTSMQNNWGVNVKKEEKKRKAKNIIQLADETSQKFTEPV